MAGGTKRKVFYATACRIHGTQLHRKGLATREVKVAEPKNKRQRRAGCPFSHGETT